MEFKKISLHLAIAREFVEERRKRAPAARRQPYLRLRQENNVKKKLREMARDKLFGFYQSFTFNYLLFRKLSCITRTAADAVK
jgi:hypothetical protein